MDARFGVAPPQHGVGDHGQIAYVAHAERERGASVEVAAQRHVIFAHQLDGVIHNPHPVVCGEFQVLGAADAHHWELGRDSAIDILNRECLIFPDRGSVPERPAGMLGPPVEYLAIVKLVANLETNDTALRRQFFQEPVGHISRDVVKMPQPMMGGNDGVRA